MRRFYRSVVETAGFANTVGFNDDSRSLLSIPARHDVARRLNAGYLADLVAEHRMDEEEAAETAADLALNLACRAFRVDREAGRAGGPDGVREIDRRRAGRRHAPDGSSSTWTSSSPRETGKTVRELWEEGGEAAYR